MNTEAKAHNSSVNIHYARTAKEMIKIRSLMKVDTSGEHRVELIYRHQQRLLGSAISDLFDEARTQVLLMRAHCVENKKVNNLKKVFWKISSAKRHCWMHIDASDKERLVSSETETKAALEKKILRMIKIAERSIECNQFKACEEHVENIKNMIEMSQECVVGDTEKAMKELDMLQNQISSKLEKIKKGYTDTKLEEQDHNPYLKLTPRALYKQLQTVIPTHARYQVLWDAVETDIVDKFIKYSAKVCDPNKDHHEREQILCVCESVLQVLPKAMGKTLSEHLERARIRHKLRALTEENEKLRKQTHMSSQQFHKMTDEFERLQQENKQLKQLSDYV